MGLLEVGPWEPEQLELQTGKELQADGWILQRHWDPQPSRQTRAMVGIQAQQREYCQTLVRQRQPGRLSVAQGRHAAQAAQAHAQGRGCQAARGAPLKRRRRQTGLWATQEHLAQAQARQAAQARAPGGHATEMLPLENRQRLQTGLAANQERHPRQAQQTAQAQGRQAAQAQVHQADVDVEQEIGGGNTEAPAGLRAPNL